jgi:hypothetical protein
MRSLLNAASMLRCKIDLKKIFSILFVLFYLVGHAQDEEQKLIQRMKEFHQALVQKNSIAISQQTDRELSYGHSNGWIETKSALIKDLETGVISYSAIREDSVEVHLNDDMANVRFVADITGTMNSSTFSLRLKVLEVWVKKRNRWILFARQAVK